MAAPCLESQLEPMSLPTQKMTTTLMRHRQHLLQPRAQPTLPRQPSLQQAMQPLLSSMPAQRRRRSHVLARSAARAQRCTASGTGSAHLCRLCQCPFSASLRCRRGLARLQAHWEAAQRRLDHLVAVVALQAGLHLLLTAMMRSRWRSRHPAVLKALLLLQLQAHPVRSFPQLHRLQARLLLVQCRRLSSCWHLRQSRP